jgi:iron complex outermembrane receptor protein
MSKERASGGATSIARRALAATLATAVALAPRGAACAATAPLDEVIVTGQRDARPAQATAASISALSGEELRERGFLSTRDLATAVPNLTWQATDGASVGSVFIRGVGSPSIHSNQLGAVGLYADDVTLNAPLLANPALLDLERVEVLRGPRNTGLGRNASGGAVHFVSRAPVVGADASAHALLRVGTEGRLDGELATGFPLGDHTAARIAVARDSLGDYVNNATLARHEGGYARTTARARWRREVPGGTDFDVGVHGSRLAGDSIRYKQIGYGTPGKPGRSDCPFLAVDPNPGNGCVDQTGFADTAAFDENFSGNPSGLSATVAGASLRIAREFAGVRLTSLTAFEGGDSRRAEDTDGGPSYLFTSWQETDSDQWSQDLRFASLGDYGRGWQLGIYLLQEDARYTSVRRNPNPLFTPSLVPGMPIPEAGVRTSVLYGDLAQRMRHASVWARADRALSSASTLAGEIRIAYEQLSGKMRSGAWADTTPELAPDQFLGTADVLGFAATSVEVGAGALTQLCPAPFALTRCYTRAQIDRSDWLWGGRLTLDRRLGNTVLGYASIARGFKGAGVSPIARDALVGRGGRAVDPERVLTFELGAKSEWRDHTLRVNGSAFINDWSDYQLYLAVSTPPPGASSVLTNLPEARTLGGELEVDWAPSPEWRARAGLGFTHSEVLNAGDIVDAVPGSPLIAVPELTFNALVARSWSLGGGRLTAQVESSYVDERSFSLNRNIALIEPEYWLVDASARYRFGEKERFEVTLWGRNLGASRYCVRRSLLRGLGSGDAITCQPNEGIRFFGLSLFARIG